MKRIRLSTFMLLVLVVSLVVNISIIQLQGRPHPYGARLEIRRLKLLKSNLHRAGMLGPNREKSLSDQIAALEAWGY